MKTTVVVAAVAVVVVVIVVVVVVYLCDLVEVVLKIAPRDDVVVF